MWTILLLILSNVFMTFAWYGHFRFVKGEHHSLAMIIFLSWGIASLEYCFMIPANRMGKETYGFSTAQLKTIQEIVTLIVFVFFSALFLKEQLRWNHLVGFACIAAAGFFVFNPMFNKGGADGAATNTSVVPPAPVPYTEPHDT
jgi:uncharacterized protein (DUF486 family)